MEGGPGVGLELYVRFLHKRRGGGFKEQDKGWVSSRLEREGRGNIRVEGRGNIRGR